MEKRVASVVESPCVRNCCLNDADICVGCFRSLEEITRWSLEGDEAKMQTLQRAAERRLLQGHKRGIGRDDTDK